MLLNLLMNLELSKRLDDKSYHQLLNTLCEPDAARLTYAVCAQSTASPYRPDCGTQNPVISAAAGLMRMVLFRRLRISYQHKQSNLRLEYSRRPKTGQTLVQDRRTS